MLVFLPMSTPEIVLGASLLTLFLNGRIVTGFATIFIAHVMFVISFIVVTVKARLIDFDRHIEEAAMDLGANEWTTFRKVTLPLLAPAILSAALLGFAISIDDFVITYFVSGPTQTFPLFVWGAARVAVPPQVNVIATRDLRRRGHGHARQRDRLGAAGEPGQAAVTLDRPATCSARPGTTCGCTSRAWARTPTSDVPIIVRGDGCYLEDANGKRYLDALAGLFSVNIGYGFGEEIGQAALEQMRELPFYTNWTYAHPRAIELAGEVASLAPGDLNRVFFCLGWLGGGRVGVEARAAVLPRPRRDEPAGARRRRPRARPRRRRRQPAHTSAALQGDHAADRLPRHDLGRALADGHPADPGTVRAARSPRCATSPTRTATGGRDGETEEEFTAYLLDELERTIEMMGPDTVCLVHLEPVQNSGGAFTPPAGYFQGVRALCDRYDILLSADEVITGFGRVGAWFASERYDIRPDLVTCAKGLSSSYAAIGAVIATDRVMEPFLEDRLDVHARDHLRRPPRAVRGGAEEHRDHEAGAHRRARRGDRGRLPREARARCSTCRSWATCAGPGFFWALELVKDKETKASFADDECEVLLRGYHLAGALRGGADLPRRRPRRPGRADLAAARRGRERDGRDRRHPRRRARRGRPSRRALNARRPREVRISGRFPPPAAAVIRTTGCAAVSLA